MAKAHAKAAGVANPSTISFVIDPLSLKRLAPDAFDVYVRTLQVINFQRFRDDFRGTASQIDRLEKCLTPVEFFLTSFSLQKGTLIVSDFMKEKVFPSSVEQWLEQLRSETLARAKGLIELTLAREESLPPIEPMANTFASLAAAMGAELSSLPARPPLTEKTGGRRKSTTSASSSATDVSGKTKRKKLERSASQKTADTRATRSQTKRVASGIEPASAARSSSSANPMELDVHDASIPVVEPKEYKVYANRRKSRTAPCHGAQQLVSVNERAMTCSSQMPPRTRVDPETCKTLVNAYVVGTVDKQTADILLPTLRTVQVYYSEAYLPGRHNLCDVLKWKSFPSVVIVSNPEELKHWESEKVLSDLPPL